MVGLGSERLKVKLGRLHPQAPLRNQEDRVASSWHVSCTYERNGCECSWLSSLGTKGLLSWIVIGQVTKTSEEIWVGTGATTAHLPLIVARWG